MSTMLSIPSLREGVVLDVLGAIEVLSRLREDGSASSAYSRWCIAQAQRRLADAQWQLSCMDWPPAVSTIPGSVVREGVDAP